MLIFYSVRDYYTFITIHMHPDTPVITHKIYTGERKYSLSISAWWDVFLRDGPLYHHLATACSSLPKVIWVALESYFCTLGIGLTGVSLLFTLIIFLYVLNLALYVTECLARGLRRCMRPAGIHYDMCSICLEVVHLSGTTDCGHSFCKPCIDRWRAISPTCPTCRKNIEEAYPLRR